MFVKKTVDSIVASFNRNIADLRALASNMSESAAEHQRAAQEHKTDAETCLAEGQRAESVARKLEQLVGA